MQAMGSFPRIAIVIDDELQRRRFVEHVEAKGRVSHVADGNELLRLAAEGGVDVAVVGVLNQGDDFLSTALVALSRTLPEVAIVGVFEPSAPSLDEAADLARQIPAMGFVFWYPFGAMVSVSL